MKSVQTLLLLFFKKKMLDTDDMSLRHLSCYAMESKKNKYTFLGFEQSIAEQSFGPVKIPFFPESNVLLFYIYFLTLLLLQISI